MEQNSLPNTTLYDYLEEQNTRSYFSGIVERYFLANEFFSSCNDTFADSNDSLTHIIPFLNLKNVHIQRLELEEGELIPKYLFIFPSIDEIGLNDHFDNYSFSDNSLFLVRKLTGLKESTNKDVITLCKKNESLYIKTLSEIAFSIYFGYHPYCGREYYSSIDLSLNAEKEFFSRERHFIFDIKDNPNRFVNGYHSKAWEFWNCITDAQKQFWIDAFSDKFETYEEFYQAWRDVYYNFVVSVIKTGCDEKLYSLVYNDKDALITSDNTIGNQSIRCRECNNALASRCGNCTLPFEKRAAEFSALKVKIEIKNAEQPSKAEKAEAETVEERELDLYDGKTVFLGMIDSKESNKAIFTVIASKKKGLLGLRCLLDTKIVATCGPQMRTFERDGIIPLLPGTRISPVEGSTIIVPGQPPEAPKKADTSMTAPASAPEATPIAAAAPAAPAEAPIAQAPTALSEVIAFDIPKFLESENGDTYDVIGASTERDVYYLIPVIKRGTADKYTVKLFKAPGSEAEKTRQEAIISNVRKNISNKLSLHPSILYPIDVIKGAVNGYVFPHIPQDEDICGVASIINSRDNLSTKKTTLDILIELCDAIASVHQAGMVYKNLQLRNILCNKKTGKCYITDNDCISPEGDDFLQVNRSSDLISPEMMYFSHKSDKYSDIYTVSVIMFLILYKMHPYGNCLYVERNNFEAANKSASANPEFCFGHFRPVHTNLYAKIEWSNTPKAIKDFFEKVFQDHITDKTPEQLVKIYSKERPDLKQWRDALYKWEQTL